MVSRGVAGCFCKKKKREKLSEIAIKDRNNQFQVLEWFSVRNTKYERLPYYPRSTLSLW